MCFDLSLSPNLGSKTPSVKHHYLCSFHTCSHALQICKDERNMLKNYTFANDNHVRNIWDKLEIYQNTESKRPFSN